MFTKLTSKERSAVQWYLKVLKNYAVFEGRASRTEFWMFMLFNVIITILLTLIENFANMNGYLSGIYGLATILPLIAVGVRRLHDAGKSGWWYFLCLIPLIGSIILLIFFCFGSEERENRFGPVPRV